MICSNVPSEVLFPLAFPFRGGQRSEFLYDLFSWLLRKWGSVLILLLHRWDVLCLQVLLPFLVRQWLLPLFLKQEVCFGGWFFKSAFNIIYTIMVIKRGRNHMAERSMHIHTPLLRRPQRMLSDTPTWNAVRKQKNTSSCGAQSFFWRGVNV